jgi:heme/copper-type cytochrome/quinol oxidase subunit 2
MRYDSFVLAEGELGKEQELPWWFDTADNCGNILGDSTVKEVEPRASFRLTRPYRLLEVDLPIFFPTHTNVRLLITSDDVLHSWAVPQLGIKTDACAGRVNQVSVYIPREGIYYGQCSELCGVSHSAMPIQVLAVSPEC